MPTIHDVTMNALNMVEEALAKPPKQEAEPRSTVIASTEHYQVVDHGADHGFTHRYVMGIKPIYQLGQVLPRSTCSGRGIEDVGHLIEEMHKAEAYHQDQMRYFS